MYKPVINIRQYNIITIVIYSDGHGHSQAKQNCNAHIYISKYYSLINSEGQGQLDKNRIQYNI